MSPSATVWLIDAFLIVSGQQLRSMVQKKKQYLALSALATLVDRIDLFWAFNEAADNEKNRDYHQPYFFFFLSFERVNIYFRITIKNSIT